jgi:hypothetical protein
MASPLQEIVHHTQFGPAAPGSPLAEEWETYRREVGALLAAGREGQHIVIRGAEILGFWPTHEEAREAGVTHGLVEPFFIHKIQNEEALFRNRYSKLCRS